MNIEAGKYYLLRNGEGVGPLERGCVPNSVYVWEANEMSWTVDGVFDVDVSSSAYDIVAEAPPAPKEPSSVVDPVLRVSETGAVKASIGKRPLHLLPRDAIEAMADVMAHGAAKYGDRNWEQGLSVSDLVRAADGHLWDWYLRRDDGKDAGPNGSGLSHLAHAACSILFLLSHELRGLPDDRPDPVPAVPQPTREG